MIGLSKSSLEIFKECPRCFWMDKVRKIPRPRGIMPSLPSGIDRAMKGYVEDCVVKGNAVAWLDGSTLVPHPDRGMIGKFRNWRTFQTVLELDGVGIKVWGEIDDVLLDDDGKVSPWDFKSKGDEPAEGYSEKYYQLQADIYHLLLNGNRCQTSGYGYFSYIWPMVCDAGAVRMGSCTQQVRTDPDRACAVLLDAAKCLERTTPPPIGASCSTCTYLAARSQAE